MIGKTLGHYRITAKIGAGGMGEVYRAHGEHLNRDGEAVQQLYKAMMESKKAAGEASNINYQQVHQFVQKKTEQLKQKMGVGRVEYRVAVEKGKVTLKVKGG